jgi:ubiquinone/menaquinone biosynthesis C-methylase UbiE
MKKSLKKRVDPLEAVYMFCLENSGIWMPLLALANAISALGLKIQTIMSTAAKQQANNKGVTLTKKQRKNGMLNIGAGIAGAMRAYSKSVSDETLFKKLTFNAGMLLKGSGINAIAACRNVYAIVSQIPLADRTPFGVTDAVLLSLKNSTDDFENKINKSTRLIITEKTMLTDLLLTLVNEGCSIMRDEILTLAIQLKEANPEFYAQLVQTSKVIPSQTHTKIRVEGRNDLDSSVLPDLKVRVQQTGQEGVTNAKGLCTIYLAEGDYNLEISKANFIAMNLSVHVKKGSNTFKVQMSPVFNVPAVNKEKVNN